MAVFSLSAAKPCFKNWHSLLPRKFAPLPHTCTPTWFSCLQIANWEPFGFPGEPHWAEHAIWRWVYHVWRERASWNYRNNLGMQEVIIKRHPPEGRGTMEVAVRRHPWDPLTELPTDDRWGHWGARWRLVRKDCFIVCQREVRTSVCNKIWTKNQAANH